MDVNYENALRRKILNYLKAYENTNGAINYKVLNDLLSSLTTEVEKHYGEWLGRTELFHMLNMKVFELTKDVKDEKINLQNIISADNLENASNEIIALIKTVPREYCFYFKNSFELDNLKINLSITKDISLDKLQSVNQMPNGYYFRVKGIGYCFGGKDCSAYLSARSKLKQFLGISILAGKIKIYEPFWLKLHKETSNVLYHDLETNTSVGEIKESEVFLDFISLIYMNEEISKDALKYQNYLNEPIKKTGISGYLLAPQSPEIIFPEMITFLESDDSNPNTNSLKRALEWSFDSMTNQSDFTLSFMQLSIALEAILGGEKEDAIVNRLSDRCAYLIGRNLTERKEIRKKFKNFYDVRSDLVHGRTKLLTKNHREHYEWGRQTLNEVLISELNLYSKQLSKHLV